MTTHIFLSPHYDDAVYSCGGTIHQLAQAGDTVHIITVMGGDPPDPLPDTPIVRALHQRWAAGDNPVAVRRDEDRAAAAVLGAATVHLPIPDCVYRTHWGWPIYREERMLWRSVNPSDPAPMLMGKPLLSYITSDAILYAPLAVGGHVDHLIVRDWVLTHEFSVTFYEDYPYSEQPGAVEATLTELPSARNQEVATVLLTEADIAAKIEAAKAYQSQISTFWQDATALEQRVRTALMQHGPPQERFHRLAQAPKLFQLPGAPHQEEETSRMTNAAQQARSKLAELIENARTGNIIPVRLTGQLEEIEALLNEVDAEAADAAQAAPEHPADVEAVLLENAEFVSVAVHELRTPMTSIRGYSDLLNMSGLAEPQQQLMDTIRTNTRRMETLLQDVSDISKIRGGTLNISQKMDMFKNIGMTVEKETASMAEDMDKVLTFEIDQGLPLLNTDGDYLAKAVRKLVENSLRYTGEDGQVTVRARGEDNTLVIEVADNGIGMSEDEIAKLGTLYWRGDNDVVREFKGSGLGIPIVYGIIKLLEGTISVESTPGEGTTFTIRLPGMS